MLKHLFDDYGFQVKEGLEYYHSLYSPYNRTIQARLFANIRWLSSSSPIFNKQSYPDFSSIRSISIFVSSDVSSNWSSLHYGAHCLYAPNHICNFHTFQCQSSYKQSRRVETSVSLQLNTTQQHNLSERTHIL